MHRVVCDKVCTYIAGSSVCTSCDAGKYQATAGDESVCVRGREGEVGNERKKDSKIHLCAWALAVGSRIYTYRVRARERGGGWESEHSLNIHTHIHTNIHMNVITGARMKVISFSPCFLSLCVCARACACVSVVSFFSPCSPFRV